MVLVADLNGIVAALRGIQPAWLLACLAVSALGEVLTIAKWRYILSAAGHRLPFRRVAHASLSGSFYGFFLPGYVGSDVARAVLLGREAGSRTVAFASAFMQRNTGLAVLLLLGNIAVALSPVRLGIFSNSILDSVQTHLLVLLIGYCGVNVFLLSSRASTAAWGMAPARWMPGPIRVRAAGMHAAILGMRQSVIPALGLSLVTQTLDCLALALGGRALGIEAPLSFYFVLLPVMSLLTLVPISLNGLGVREAAGAVLLRGIGQPAGVGFALGVIQTAAQVMVALAGAVAQLAGRVSRRGAGQG
jgi:uncharacterized membrane protein YbhN (UPF0104 family)